MQIQIIIIVTSVSNAWYNISELLWGISRPAIALLSLIQNKVNK